MEGNNRNILIGLIAVVIALAVFSSFGLPLFAGPTATITLPTPLPRETKEPGSLEQTGGVRVEVTPQTVQSVISVMERLESYSRTVTTTLEGSSAVAWVWVDEGWTRADMDLPSGLSVHTIVGDGRLWRWYGTEQAVLSWEADSSSMDIEGQRIPTYEDVLLLKPEDITAAGYEEREDQPCVYVEAGTELGYTERYWISVDSGLLVAAETEKDGEVVYAMTARDVVSPLDETQGIFVLPDGTVLH